MKFLRLLHLDLVQITICERHTAEQILYDSVDSRIDRNIIIFKFNSHWPGVGLSDKLQNLCHSAPLLRFCSEAMKCNNIVEQVYDLSLRDGGFTSLTHLLHSGSQLAGGCAPWTPACSECSASLRILRHYYINLLSM